MHDIFFELKKVSNFIDFEEYSKKILCKLFLDREKLRNLILEAPNNQKTFSQNIRYEAVDKIVLWNSEDLKMQLRLHIYADRFNRSISSSQANIEQAHNHRWNFSSLILSGGYRHVIYHESPTGDPSASRLLPCMIRQESVGDCYTLHHSLYHSIIEIPNTVSLIIRGPLEKEHFNVINDTEKLKWNTKMLSDNPERSFKAISHKEYDQLVNQLIKLNIISE